MKREKAYRDPVHDFITIRDPLFLDLIDTPEFQRLRRIRQLGSSYGTYHGAEHSRFGHSLGVLWIMSRILDRLSNIGVTVDEEWHDVCKVAALLHDVGHGPFSHALEGALTPGMDHEVWSQRIILGPGVLSDRLRAHDPALPRKVAAVISGKLSTPGFVIDLVSSQMDVDRMDYLIRDSLYTGVTYGRFDLTRLINTLHVVDDRIVCVAKGIGAVEEYLLARYFMYWQVYLHKTTRSHDLMLRRWWQRVVDLWQASELNENVVPPSLVPFLRGNPSLEEYLRIDDHDIAYAMKLWQDASDPILADFSDRLLSRRLFKPVYKVAPTAVPLDRLAAVEKWMTRQGWDPNYYLMVDDVSGVAYDLYAPDDFGADEHRPGDGRPSAAAAPGESGPLGEDAAPIEDGPLAGNASQVEDGPLGKSRSSGKPAQVKRPILVLDESGTPREITQLSATMRALAAGPRVAVNVFVPEQVRESVRELLTD